MTRLHPSSPLVGGICLVALVFVGDARGETADLAWQQTVGVTDYHDPGYNNPLRIMVPDTAGGSLYAGLGRTSDGTALWVNKLNPAGNLVWSRDLGEAVGTTLASDLVTDRAGNVFIAGSTTESLSGPNQGGTDAFVAKLNATTGNPVWIRQIGAADDENVTKIARDPKGAIYVAMGDSLAKLAPAGNVVWQKVAAATQLRLDAAGNPVTAGTDAAGKNWVAKWLPNGGLDWKKNLSGVPSSVVVDPFGNIIVAHGNKMAKYAEDGVLQWSRPQPTSGNLSADLNGDIYVMTGSTELSKFSGADGEPYWAIDVDLNTSRSLFYVRTDSNGKSVVIGVARPDTGQIEDFFWVAKFDSTGNLMWYEQADNPDPACDEITIADGSLHRTGDVFVGLNTEDSMGSRFLPWGIRFDVSP